MRRLARNECAIPAACPVAFRQGSRIVIGEEDANAVAIIDTATNAVLSTNASVKAPQGMVYIPGAVATGDGLSNLQLLAQANDSAHLALVRRSSNDTMTTVAIDNQALVDGVQAAVTGLEPK